MSKPTNGAIIATGVNLLRGGLLPSALPARLMDDYSLTPEQARELAGAAIRRWRLDTRRRGVAVKNGD